MLAYFLAYSTFVVISLKRINSFDECSSHTFYYAALHEKAFEDHRMVSVQIYIVDFFALRVLPVCPDTPQEYFSASLITYNGNSGCVYGTTLG